MEKKSHMTIIKVGNCLNIIVEKECMLIYKLYMENTLLIQMKTVLMELCN